MKCVVGNQLVLSRTPEGPIAPHIGSFGEFLDAQGYAYRSSTAFSRDVSGTGQSPSQTYVPAMSWRLFSAKHRVCR